MNKFISLSLLLTLLIFASCRKDEYYEPQQGQGEAISLSVSDAGFTNSDGSLSRSQDTSDGLTKFEKNDTVGLIILDANDRLLADNLPYKYNGTKWDFCTENTEGKERAFFDKEMTKYIVYYPYTKEADGKKTEDELLGLDDLAWVENQSTEDAYRRSDVLIWTDEGSPLKEIKAEMHHARNSLSLDLKVRYKLTLKDQAGNPVVIDYHPKRFEGNAFLPNFEDFTLYMGSKNILDSTYNPQNKSSLANLHEVDGSYRYILREGCDSTFSWRYYYRGKTYGGKLDAKPTDKGIRYKVDEFIDMGVLYGTNSLPGDFYCTETVGDTLTGYVLPQDALECLLGRTCIGLVYYVGQHPSDDGAKFPYPDSIYNGTETQSIGKCHGYVVALTNACASPVNWCVQAYEDTDMGTSSSTTTWNGYYNFNQVKENTRYRKNPLDFPAIYYCDIYGNGESNKLKTPYNSTCWFLPAAAQGQGIVQKYPLLEPSFKVIAALNQIQGHIDTELSIGFSATTASKYWSSTEQNAFNNIRNSIEIYKGGGELVGQPKFGKDALGAPRPILVF